MDIFVRRGPNQGMEYDRRIQQQTVKVQELKCRGRVGK